MPTTLLKSWFRFPTTVYSGLPVDADVIVKEVETANQSNSQGAADDDVQTEESQAKVGAWELFTGSGGSWQLARHCIAEDCHIIPDRQGDGVAA